jgi:predicted RNA-binding Zn ribbon-like protein
MTSRPPAIFVADAEGLDFLNSIATPVDTPLDWIEDGAGLLDWIEESGLIPPKALKHLRKHAMPGELDGVAAQARSLREWFRAFVDEHKGRPLNSTDLTALEPLNRLLERDESFKRIVARESGKDEGFTLQASRRWRSPESILLPIAESLAQFICDEDFTHVKQCEGDHCTILFADHTRGRQRRWCSMAACGNRAKQAAHRERRKSKSPHQ